MLRPSLVLASMLVAGAAQAAPDPRVHDLPWHKTGPNDRTDPRVYDFSGELSTDDWVGLEKIARGLEHDTGDTFVIAIFTQRNATTEAVCTDIGERWHLQKGRLVQLCSFLDSVMMYPVSPSLLKTLTDERRGEIVEKRIFPLYQQGRIVAGLSQGLYAYDELLTGRAHPASTELPPPTEPPAKEDAPQPSAPVVAVTRAWYQPDVPLEMIGGVVATLLAAMTLLGVWLERSEDRA